MCSMNVYVDQTLKVHKLKHSSTNDVSMVKFSNVISCSDSRPHSPRPKTSFESKTIKLNEEDSNIKALRYCVPSFYIRTSPRKL